MVSLKRFALASIVTALLATGPRAGLYIAEGWKMQEEAKAGQSGEQISSGGYSTSGWYDATVPGTVLANLVDQGVYPDPYFGTNLKSIPEELNKKKWWYRVDFDLDASYEGKRVWLDFEGINYKADIYLNGTSVGSMRGAFKRGYFDVTSAAKTDETNSLAVRIHPNDNPGTPHMSVSSTCGPNCGSREIGRDGPTFQATLGWDWTPGIPDRSIGIFLDVHVEQSGPVAIRDPFIVTDLPLPERSPARLNVSAELENAAGGTVDATLRGEIAGTGITFERDASVSSSQRALVTFTPDDFSQLVMSNPRLWWPVGYGDANLYELKLKALVDGEVSDTQTVRFGVREFEFDMAPELLVKVNGEKILVRGGNWGMDDAMKRMPPERLKACIRLHKEAHLNMIRNWVGLSDNPLFFDLCDESGILVYNDFWLNADCAHPSDQALFFENAEDRVRRYRNHPSICIWAASNDRPPGEPYETEIPNLLKKLDGTRRYQLTSRGYGVHPPGGPFGWETPESYFYRGTGFNTECGHHVIVSAESMREMMPASELWPRNDTWGFHDFCQLSWTNVDKYINAIDSRYGGSNGIEEYCKKAQLANMEAHQAIYEGYIASMFDDATGILVWVTNPSWPNLTWQLYDHFLEGTGAYYGAKKANEPVHVMLNLVDRHVLVANHTLRPLSDLAVEAKVYNADGAEKGSRSETVGVGPDDFAGCFTLELPSGLSSVYFVKLTLRDAGGALLSQNFYWRSSSGADFKALNNLPSVELESEAEHKAGSGENVITASLRNPSSNVAFSVRLKLLRAESLKRVLPAYYDDNYFSLVPGESRAVAVRFDPRYLDDEKPKLMVEGYNLAETEVPITSVDARPRPLTGPVGAGPGIGEIRVYDGRGRLVKRLDESQVRAAGLSAGNAVARAAAILPHTGVYFMVLYMIDGRRAVKSKRLLVR
jgi:hypothetical protein